MDVFINLTKKRKEIINLTNKHFSLFFFSYNFIKYESWLQLIQFVFLENNNVFIFKKQNQVIY